MNQTNTAAPEKAKKHFLAKGEIGYAIGGAGQLPNGLITIYFTIFCTTVLGISAKWMAGLLLAARIWDAINDPLIGSCPDRWKIGKSGQRFKPYIKVFKYFYAIFGALCFVNITVANPSERMLHAWVALVYVLFGMSNTAVMMPYNAMLSYISAEPSERVKLSRGRLIGSLITSGVLSATVPLLCFNADNTMNPQKIFAMALACSLLCIVCFVFMDKTCPEMVVDEPKAKEKYSYKKAFGQIFRNRPLMGMMLVALGLALNSSAPTLKTYYFTTYYENASSMSLSAFSLPLSFVMMMISPVIAKKIGQRMTCIWSVGLTAVIKLLLFLIPISNPYLFIILEMIPNLTIIPASVSVWSMLSCALDYGEWKYGARGDGATYSIYTFTNKFGNAFGVAALTYGLELVGYVSGQGVVQSAATVAGLRTLYLLTPVIAMALMLIGVAAVYNLSDKKIEEISRDLKERRAAQTAAAQKAD